MNLKELIRAANLPTLLDAIRDLSELGNEQAIRLNAAINNPAYAPVKACQNLALFREDGYIKALEKDSEAGGFNNKDSDESASITESRGPGK